MKKSLLILGLAVTLFSCNKNEGGATEFKTAYVDTQKLMDDSEALKDLNSRSNVKGEELKRELNNEYQKLKLDYAKAQDEAPRRGAQWVQAKAQEFQEREQKLSMMQDGMMRQLQEEFAPQRDSIVEEMRAYIKDYGKKNGYDYIYGTGDSANVLYAKDSYEITEEIITAVNAKFKGENPDAVKTEEKATEEKAETTEKEEAAK